MLLLNKNKISKLEYSDLSESERLDLEKNSMQLSRNYDDMPNVISIKSSSPLKTNITYKKTDLKICQDNIPKPLEIAKEDYFQYKNVYVNTRLDHLKTDDKDEELLKVNYQDSKNQFGNYLRAIKTARGNISNFELNERSIRRSKMKIKGLGPFPHLDTFSPNRFTQNPSFSRPLPEFLKFTSPSTTQKSRNKRLKIVQTLKPKTATSNRRVISVYSSHSKRRARIKGQKQILSPFKFKTISQPKWMNDKGNNDTHGIIRKAFMNENRCKTSLSLQRNLKNNQLVRVYNAVI